MIDPAVFESHVDRIAALEAALSECIGYLKRLPPVHPTMQQIQRAATVLNAPPPSRPSLYGDIGMYHGLGPKILSVHVTGETAMLLTEVPVEAAQHLHYGLTQGIEIKLHRKT